MKNNYKLLSLFLALLIIPMAQAQSVEDDVTDTGLVSGDLWYQNNIPYKLSFLDRLRMGFGQKLTVIDGASCSDQPDKGIDYTPSKQSIERVCETNNNHIGVAFQLFKTNGRGGRHTGYLGERQLSKGEKGCFNVEYGQWYHVDYYYCDDTSERQCSDTDGGRRYTTKGTVTFRYSDSSSGSYDDKCETDKMLLERYCDSQNSLASTQYTCSGSCNDGKCVTAPPPSQCSSWGDVGCGVYPCDSNEMNQGREGSSCDSWERCVSSSACVGDGGGGLGPGGSDVDDIYIKEKAILGTPKAGEKLPINVRFKNTGPADFTFTAEVGIYREDFVRASDGLNIQSFTILKPPMSNKIIENCGGGEKFVETRRIRIAANSEALVEFQPRVPKSGLGGLFERFQTGNWKGKSNVADDGKYVAFIGIFEQCGSGEGGDYEVQPFTIDEPVVPPKECKWYQNREKANKLDLPWPLPDLEYGEERCVTNKYLIWTVTVGVIAAILMVLYGVFIKGRKIRR